MMVQTESNSAKSDGRNKLSLVGAAVRCLAVLLVFYTLSNNVSAKGITFGDEAFKAEMLLDKEAILTIDRVVGRENVWQNATSEKLSIGFYPGAVWLRVTPTLKSSDEDRYYLEVPYTTLDYVTAYVFHNEQLIATYQMGDRQPFSSRPVNFKNILIPFSQNDEITPEIYLAIKSSGLIAIPLTIWGEQAFNEHRSQTQLISGWYFGVMFIMALYNFFIYFKLRDKNYLIYTVFALVVGSFHATMYGYTFQYLWPDMPEFNRFAIPVLFALIGIIIPTFTVGLFEVKRKYPRLFKAFKFIRWVYFLSFLLILVVPYNVAMQLLIFITCFFVPFSLLNKVYFFFNESLTGKLFAFSWSGMILAIVLEIIGRLSLPELLPLAEIALRIGSAVEIVLLSFALANRIGDDREAKIKAEQEKQMAVEERYQFEQLAFQLQIEELKAQQKIVETQAESQAKSDFLATMSHEIRTPMNGVIGMAALLEDTELSPDQRKYLKVIISSGKALLNIINDVLDYTKIDAGKLRLEKIDFNIRELCDDCVALFSVVSEQKGIRLINNVPASVPKKVKTDPYRLRQVLLNLLGNAFKFTEHGTIKLKVSTVDESADKMQLLFTIDDTGIGLSEEEQAKLFNTFSQANDSVSRKYGGTGLGLSIAKMIVEHMGGNIGFSSKKDIGSQFWFTVDVDRVLDTNTEPKPLAEPIIRQSLPSKSLPKHIGNILIAEDNEVNRMVTESMLKKLNLRCHIAVNGAEAVRMFCQDHALYDLVLLDCDMPIMDGYEACEYMRHFERKNELKSTPIIALTAHVLTDHQQKVEQVGMDEHLPKPVDFNALRNTLCCYLGATVYIKKHA